jgi:hypothetical protein
VIARAVPTALIGAAIAAALAAPAASQPGECAREASSIRRAEGQLPRLDVAPPDDKQIVCITLETNMLFARRLAAHLAKCPRSPLARDGEAWRATGTRYAAQFRDRRCRPTIRDFRG